ncbi:MAG TPA: DNA polymerase III subunit delta, partial [Aestuariivirgaceae bacterium]|nr:DNA polymerase III subunit delta [Aestuariivirgaceae bacterium]
MGAGFASTDRFLAELNENKLRPGYVLIGDDVFLYERCRRAVLAALVPPEMRDFCLSDLDLAETTIFEALDRAQTPSLMAPFQVLFIRNLKNLYTRGAKKEEFAAVEAYFKSPNPQALILFVADHIRIPSDPRRMDYDDRNRYDRIRETLGDWCGLVELARVDESDALKWIAAEAKRREVQIDNDAARELADALGADMMLIASELEKLALYVGAKKLITLGDVETMVLAAKQRSLY